MALIKSALADLKRSGLSEETIERMGVYSVEKNKKKWLKDNFISSKIDHQEIARMTEFYAIPYPQGFVRIKLENEIEGKKYLQPYGEKCRLYYMPGEEKKLKKRKHPIIFTEGEKKTAKLFQELDKDYLAIGCPGISSWRTFDWQGISLNKREVWIAFDRPVAVHGEAPKGRHIELEMQLLSLFAFFVKKGAVPYFLIYPNEKVDDWLALEPNPKESLRETIIKSKKYDNVFDVVKKPDFSFLIEKFADFRYDKNDIGIFWDKYQVSKKCKVNKTTAKAMLRKQYVRNLQDKYEGVDWLEVDENGKRKVVPGRLARTMLEKYANGLIFFHGSFWTYSKTSGTWSEETEGGKRIKAMIQRELGDDLCKKSFVEDIFFQMQNYAVHEDVAFKFNMHKQMLNLQNGVLDLDSMEMFEHDKSYYFTSKISAKYDLGADCPKWKKFLFDTELGKSTIDRIQEWFGYCLVPETRMQRALFLVGPGGNGKSVILETIDKLLNEYRTSFDISEMFNRFNLGQTENALVNICADCNSAIPVNERLKAFINGESMPSEKKGKDGHPFNPHARLLFAANDFLTTKDRSHGFYRKFDVIKMEKIWKEKDQNKNLKYEIWDEELSGVLLWAIEGLKRLKKNNWMFTESKEMDQNLLEFKTESNPLLQFLNECCEIDEKSEKYYETEHIYAGYVAWCERTKHMPFTSSKFGRELKKAHPELDRKRMSKSDAEGKRPYLYRGITLLGTDPVSREPELEKPKKKDRPQQPSILDKYLSQGYGYEIEKEEKNSDNVFVLFHTETEYIARGWMTRDEITHKAKEAFEKHINENSTIDAWKENNKTTIATRDMIADSATREHNLFENESSHYDED